ncbi:MAG: radical SAM protein [Candidatus Rhabdochlamydia sp.]
MTAIPVSSQFPLYKINQEVSPATLFATPTLQYVCLKINDICNAKCSFCDIWQKQIDHHPDINWLHIIDDLIDLGAKEINIHGGEAFLSKTFFPMLEYGGNRTAFSIITNGILLTRFYERLFKANIRRIYISIDHHDPLLNAKSRGIPKLEKELFPVIEKIKKEQPHVQLIVNHVVSSYNIDTIDLLIIKMKELGFDAINLIPIKDTPNLYVSKPQIAAFYEKIDKIMQEGVISSKDFLNGLYKLYGTESNWDLATKGIYNLQQKKACIIPAAVMFVNGPDGNVFPCDTTMYRENKEQYIMGNILKNTIKEIWLGEMFQEFRKKMFPKITCNCIQGCDPANAIY